MKRSFERFCEETDVQGLSYISKANSSATKILWTVAVLGSVTALFTLVGYNGYLYSLHPMGIDQMLEKDIIELPQIQICFRWAVSSNEMLKYYHVSQDLARVLQWRIEATYLADAYSKLEDYAMINRSYPDIVDLLSRTRAEYEELLRQSRSETFQDLVWEIRPKTNNYQWMKFKDETGFVMPKEANSTRPFIFSYYEVEMGFATFLCEEVIEAHKGYAVEIPINYPKREELYRNSSSSMTPIFLALSRLAIVKDAQGNVVARIRPGTNVFVSYSIRRFEAIDTLERPCKAKEDGCLEQCQREAILDTFEGCRNCQSLFTQIHMGNYTNEQMTNLNLCDPWEYGNCDFTPVALKRANFKIQYTYGVQTDTLEMEEGSSLIRGATGAFLSRIIIEPEKGPLRSIAVKQYEIMSIASILSDFGGYLGLFLGSSLLTVIHLGVFCFREASNFLRCRSREQRSLIHIPDSNSTFLPRPTSTTGVSEPDYTVNGWRHFSQYGKNSSSSPLLHNAFRQFPPPHSSAAYLTSELV